MKKGMAILLIGVVIIAIAIGVFIYSLENAGKMVKEINVEAHSTKNLTYQLQKGDYVLVIESSKNINYRLLNSTDIVVDGKNVTKVNKNLSGLNGNYTLEIDNLNNETVDVKVIFNGDGADELMGGYIYFQHMATNAVNTIA
jgi:hypothetical protein